MKYTQWINYKGKTFLFINMAGLKEAEYIEALREYQKEWTAKPGSAVLMDIRNTTMTSATKEAGKEVNQAMTAFTDQYNIPKQPTAVVGISAMSRLVANLISAGQNVHFASDIESAKEWLYQNT